MNPLISAAVFSAEPKRLVPVFAGADICREAGLALPQGSCWRLDVLSAPARRAL